ncbi:TniQ family protein [Lonepinella sp. BR2919]|uniref:TniQ family protein n=1 Tax=unclassified Lonepinella TaxID=2642006 RepID=UPI003F6DCAE9
MGTTDTGFTQNYRIKPNTLKTIAYPDESINSWLIRAAFDCGTEPLTFTGFYWGKLRLWTYDLDRGFENINPQIYTDIATLSINHCVRLENHSLYKALKPINGEQTLHKGQAKWVIPRSTRNRTHKSGQPYCIGCLEHKPYLRNMWRLAWNFGCLEHGYRLNDKCEHCGTLYQPHLLTMDKRRINYCHQCSEKLNVHTVRLNEREKYILHTLNSVYLTDVGVCFGKTVNAQTYFAVLRYFINFLRRVSISKSTHLNVKFIEMLGIKQADLCQTKTALAFELLEISERINLLDYALKILDTHSEILIKTIQESGITQGFLKFEPYPEWLAQWFQHASQGKSLKSKKRVLKIPTLSVRTLSRKWECVKRQLQL